MIVAEQTETAAEHVHSNELQQMRRLYGCSADFLQMYARHEGQRRLQAEAITRVAAVVNVMAERADRVRAELIEVLRMSTSAVSAAYEGEPGQRDSELLRLAEATLEARAWFLDDEFERDLGMMCGMAAAMLRAHRDAVEVIPEEVAGVHVALQESARLLVYLERTEPKPHRWELIQRMNRVAIGCVAAARGGFDFGMEAGDFGIVEDKAAGAAESFSVGGA